MRLSSVSIRHFRNLGSQELELPPEGVALIGDNAQGKSNFLEAIYYLETLRSFRGAKDDQLVAFGEDVFRVAGTAEPSSDEAGTSSEVAAAFQRRGKKKKVTIDGSEPERLGDALGSLGAVIFAPADIELVSGGPRERRRFVDIVLSLNRPGYLLTLQGYRKALSQRNAALKAGASGAEVGAWDATLTATGSDVIVARAEWVEQRRDAFAKYYRTISNGVSARLAYRPNVRTDVLDDTDAVASAFRDALRDSAERERRRGVTVVGPHRDDLRLQLERDEDEIDLRDYGSGGQRRTAALALRLVEAETIRDRRGRRPLILLDDVFAELDAGRSERVLEVLNAEESGQVVLTAPKESDVRFRSGELARWRIASGRIDA